MGLRVVCIINGRTIVIVRKSFVENIIIIKGREKRLREPNFWRKRKVWRVSYFVPNAAEQALKFFQYFRMGPDTFWYILHNIRPYIEKQSNFRKCISPEERLAVTLM